MANFCTYCGSAVSEGDKFCGNCGAEIPTSNSLKQNENKLEEVFVNDKGNRELVNEQSNINKVSLVDKIKLSMVKSKNRSVYDGDYVKKRYILVFLVQVVMFILYSISALYMLKFEKVVLSPILYLGLLWFGVSILNVLILMLTIRKGAINTNKIESNQFQLGTEGTEQVALLNYDKVSETNKLTNTNSEV